MKVSIIIPIYNLGNQVVKCLNSIAEQDFERSEYEIIVVLDSCTDNSEAFYVFEVYGVIAFFQLYI